MSRSRWNQYNFTELERDKERIKQKKKNKKNNIRLTETKDYNYFKKYGTYRSSDNCLSLKEEALYKYFAYIE